MEALRVRELRTLLGDQPDDDLVAIAVNNDGVTDLQFVVGVGSKSGESPETGGVGEGRVSLDTVSENTL